MEEIDFRQSLDTRPFPRLRISQLCIVKFCNMQILRFNLQEQKNMEKMGDLIFLFSKLSVSVAGRFRVRDVRDLHSMRIFWT